jgi:hypothetical protein
MTQYFQLREDVNIAGRWYLGEVTRHGTPQLNFLNGCKLEGGDLLSIALLQNGSELEFCLTSFAVPVVSTSLGSTIALVAQSDVQLFPAIVANGPNRAVLNATRTISCLDESQSEFIRWLPEDGRLDRIGEYRMVTRLKLDRELIPEATHVFRVAGWTVALVVSAAVRDAMINHGCLGANFVQVSD